MTTAKEIEEKIIEAVKNNSYIEADEDDSVLFPDVEKVCSYDGNRYSNAVKITLKDGTEVYLTIYVC